MNLSRLIPVPVIACLLLSGCACWTHPAPVAAKPKPPVIPAPQLVEVAPESGFDQSLLQPPSGVYKLGPGDELEIEMMGDDTSRASVTVGPDGKIYYYLLPGLQVWGLTLPEARDLLGRELQRYVREKPVVSLSLRRGASQRIWILGRVNKPGVFALEGPTTVIDAISQAGGLSSGSPLAALAGSLGISGITGSSGDAADLSHSFVIRQGRIIPIDFQRLLRDGDLSQDIYLQPDDFIFLPSARSSEIHVLGAVAQPHAVRISGSLTLVQAIAGAGGLIPDACLAQVAIVRGSVSHPRIAIVELDRILCGKATDVRLEPGDIVFVPYTPYRTLERYANLILDTFARTVGINEGAHAVSGNSQTAGISVSVAP